MIFTVSYYIISTLDLFFLSRAKNQLHKETCPYFYCRELLEESGLTVNELEEAGILKFEFLGEPEIMEVHVFTTNKHEGTPTESEGKLELFLNVAKCNLGYIAKFKTKQCWSVVSPMVDIRSDQGALLGVTWFNSVVVKVKSFSRSSSAFLYRLTH